MGTKKPPNLSGAHGTSGRCRQGTMRDRPTMMTDADIRSSSASPKVIARRIGASTCIAGERQASSLERTRFLSTVLHLDLLKQALDQIGRIPSSSFRKDLRHNRVDDLVRQGGRRLGFLRWCRRDR